MEDKRQGDDTYDGPDEFFGDDAEQGDILEQDGTMAARDIAALSARLRTLGYQDGVEAGVEETVQDGFDRGYAAGASTGWEAGLLYGGAAGIAVVLAQSAARQVRVAGRGKARAGAEQLAPSSEGQNTDSGTGVSPSTAQQNPGDVPRGDEKDMPDATGAAAGCSDDEVEVEGKDKDTRKEQADKLVGELRQAALLGPDVAKISKEQVLERMRVICPAGAAVANRLAEELR